MVFHADRLQLGCDGRHDQPHVLGHGVCLRRRQFVHGLCRNPLPSPQGRTGEVRTREQEAGMVAHRIDRGGRRRHAGPRLVCMGEIRQRPGRRGGG